MKFGMVRLDTCIDDVGGFPDSNIIIIMIMTDTNNSGNKNHTYKLINVLRGANVEFIYMCVDLVLNLAWFD